MNKNLNNVVELTEKELACVCGGSTETGYTKERLKEIEKELNREWPAKGIRTATENQPVY